MFVAQITEPADQGEHNDQYMALKTRFPAYQFSIMMDKRPFIIGRVDPHTILLEGDDVTELEMLRFIVTSLLDEIITGYMITDGQEELVAELHTGGPMPGDGF